MPQESGLTRLIRLTLQHEPVQRAVHHLVHIGVFLLCIP